MKKYAYRIDFAQKKIEISKSFEKAASVVNSEAYRQLMKLLKGFPGFGIATTYISNVKKTKQSYKNLSLDEMRKNIVEWDGTTSVHLEELDKAREDKVSYPIIKKWFLNIYKDRFEKVTEMPVNTENQNTKTPIAV